MPFRNLIDHSIYYFLSTCYVYCYLSIYKKPGSFTVSSTNGLVFKQTGSGETTALGASDVTGLSFVQSVNGNALVVKLKVGNDELEFTGFHPQDYYKLQDLFKVVCPGIEFPARKYNLSGQNWGDLSVSSFVHLLFARFKFYFLGTFSFTADNRPFFEFPTMFISQADANPKNRTFDIRLYNDPANKKGDVCFLSLFHLLHFSAD